MNFTFPAGFGYILNEVHLNIVVDTASDFNRFALLRMSQTSDATKGFNYRILIPMDLSSQNGVANEVLSTSVRAGMLPRTPITPTDAAATTSLSIANLADPAKAGGALDALLSFWQYDLEQLAYFPAHAAANVVTR